MSDTTTNSLHVAAALADEIYRRDTLDFGIRVLSDEVADIAATAITLGHLTTRDGAMVTQVGDYYYGMDTGFVGRVVEKDNVIYVVYRGTDLAGGLADIAAANLGYSDPDPARIDVHDWDMANVPLGAGTLGRSQLDDALALYDAAKAASQGKQIVVVGQSLGGGLAGLVGALRDVNAIGFNSAPFNKQLEAEAQRNAVEYVEQSYSEYLSAQFLGATLAEKVRWLEEKAFVYSTAEAGIRAQIEAAYDAYRDTRHQVYLNSLSEHFQAHIIAGEALSSGAIGAFVETFADQLNVAPTFYAVGDGNAVSLHGYSLIDLVVRTSTEHSFGDLLANDGALRFAFLGEAGAGGVLGDYRSGIAGVESSPRADNGISTSGMGSEGVSASEVYRVLRKTVADTDGLYSYFHKVFSDTLTQGAVAEGLTTVNQLESLHTLHGGVVQLALGVFRDAIQDANGDLAAVRNGHGGHFAGSSNGHAYPDKVVIDTGSIDGPLVSGDIETSQVDITGRPWGVREIDVHVAEELVGSLTQSRVALGDAGLIVEAVLGATPGEFANTTTKHMGDWKVFVGQAGSADGVLNYNAGLDAGGAYKTFSHVIVGGQGHDIVAGSDAVDFVVGGAGDDRFETGGNSGSPGRDVFIGGANDDTYIAKSESSGAGFGVIFVGGDGEDTADYHTSGLDAGSRPAWSQQGLRGRGSPAGRFDHRNRRLTLTKLVPRRCRTTRASGACSAWLSFASEVPKRRRSHRRALGRHARP